MFGVSGCWFVNDGIDGGDITRLLRLRKEPAKKTRIPKEIYSSPVNTNSSEIHLNDKNPLKELSTSQEKLSHGRSNYTE